MYIYIYIYVLTTHVLFWDSNLLHNRLAYTPYIHTDIHTLFYVCTIRVHAHKHQFACT
jgi:hypothetical protein